MILQMVQVSTDAHKAAIRALLIEYGDLIGENLQVHYGYAYDFTRTPQHVDEFLAHLSQFMPPNGRYLMAMADGQLAGMGAMRRLSDSIAEFKRLYVRESHRGLGIGKQLLLTLLQCAEADGYQTVRLNSFKFWVAANTLYQRLGFQPINHYPEADASPDLIDHFHYMERTL